MPTLAAMVRAKHPGAYDDLSDAELEKAVLAKYPDYADLASPPPVASTPTTTQSDVGSVGSAGLRGLLPIAQEGVERFATSPTVPKTAASIGRVIGGVAPAIGGAYEAGPVGALAGLAAAAKGAWAGGKTGWFTGKLAQSMALPVASGLEKIAPAMTKMVGTQGVGDLAQMAEPQRKDIGFLGIGKTQPVAGQQPALLNLLMSKLMKIGSE